MEAPRIQLTSPGSLRSTITRLWKGTSCWLSTGAASLVGRGENWASGPLGPFCVSFVFSGHLRRMVYAGVPRLAPVLMELWPGQGGLDS